MYVNSARRKILKIIYGKYLRLKLKLINFMERYVTEKKYQ